MKILNPVNLEISKFLRMTLNPALRMRAAGLLPHDMIVQLPLTIDSRLYYLCFNEL